jgi:hypothetical protein
MGTRVVISTYLQFSKPFVTDIDIIHENLKLNIQYKDNGNPVMPSNGTLKCRTETLGGSELMEQYLR